MSLCCFLPLSTLWGLFLFSILSHIVGLCSLNSRPTWSPPTQSPLRGGASHPPQGSPGCHGPGHVLKTPVCTLGHCGSLPEPAVPVGATACSDLLCDALAQYRCSSLLKVISQFTREDTCRCFRLEDDAVSCAVHRQVLERRAQRSSERWRGVPRAQLPAQDWLLHLAPTAQTGFQSWAWQEGSPGDVPPSASTQPPSPVGPHTSRTPRQRHDPASDFLLPLRSLGPARPSPSAHAARPHVCDSSLIIGNTLMLSKQSLHQLLT